MLTSEQVADKLQVSTYTVLRLIHNGALEAVKIGRGYRVSQHWLDDYIARQATNDNAATARAGHVRT